MTTDMDARLTFETFVVGPANRLAAAAARRAAESPGSGYNPLFLYSASGLGKSHILSAIAHHSKRSNPDAVVRYETLEGYLDELTRALQRGDVDTTRDHFRKADILLLDDVQFLAGQAEAQEMLLRTLDALTRAGGQVVLASDRPPAEIDDLDARLLSRFSGGLIVDIGQPDYETRVAIMRRKAEDRGGRLAPGVAEAIGRHPFRNVRELQGALNRLLATQELEARIVEVSELSELLGIELDLGPEEEDQDEVEEAPSGERWAPDPFPSLPEPSPPKDPPWKRAFREAIDAVTQAGFSPHRLRRHLDSGAEPDDWRAVLVHFRTDVDRLREIRAELDTLGDPWPEAASTLLRDPDRIEEAEGLLASAKERVRPFPEISDGPDLEALQSHFPPMAFRAAQATISGERPEYNPLFLHSPEEGRLLLFMEGAARAFRKDQPEGKVALISVPEFAEEFIRAISDGVAGAWRERWWTVDLLLLRKAEGLAFTERAQEEFFHLFEALKRRGARVILAGDRAPSRLTGIEDRLLTRFEGGLVVDLGSDSDDRSPPPGRKDGPGRDASEAPPAPDDGDDVLAALRAFAGVTESEASPTGDEVEDGVMEGLGDPEEVEEWYPHPERVVWRWPRLEDRIVEEDR